MGLSFFSGAHNAIGFALASPHTPHARMSPKRNVVFLSGTRNSIQENTRKYDTYVLARHWRFPDFFIFRFSYVFFCISSFRTRIYKGVSGVWCMAGCCLIVAAHAENRGKKEIEVFCRRFSMRIAIFFRTLPPRSTCPSQQRHHQRTLCQRRTIQRVQ